jgi:hypothetical protein
MLVARLLASDFADTSSLRSCLAHKHATFQIHERYVQADYKTETMKKEIIEINESEIR